MVEISLRMQARLLPMPARNEEHRHTRIDLLLPTNVDMFWPKITGRFFKNQG